MSLHPFGKLAALLRGKYFSALKAVKFNVTSTPLVLQLGDICLALDVQRPAIRSGNSSSSELAVCRLTALKSALDTDSEGSGAAGFALGWLTPESSELYQPGHVQGDAVPAVLHRASSCLETNLLSGGAT